MGRSSGVGGHSMQKSGPGRPQRSMLGRLVAVALVATAVGCASGGGPPNEVPPPPDSPLARVHLGQSDYDVHAILGPPTRYTSYQTGKRWVPFYYGPDTSRLDWIYQGTGRVVFSRNRYSGELKVIRIVYDPTTLR